MHYRYYLAAIFLFLISSCEQRKAREIPNSLGVVAENAMVVSAHPLASQVGIEVLKNGGNAIDAAVAIHFALAVVYPGAGNIGGGGFLVYRTNSGEFYTLDYREKAPAMAGRDMYLNDSGEVDNEKSRLGHLAAGIPGSVDGMVTAHQRFGSKSWEELLEPSIDLAKNGFLLTEKEASNLNRAQERIEKYCTIKPENVIKESWHEGDTIYYKNLAETLTRIAEKGIEGFYEGETARLIVEEMERGNGLISYEDLMNYSSVWRDPISFNYKNFNITSMGPPSSGGVAIAQLFTMIEQFPIKDWGIDHINTIHAMTESEKLVYADRARYLGDPDFVQMPIDELMDLKYNQARASNFNFEKASIADDILAGQFVKEPEETTHFSIIDQFGNAVSSTTTLNGGFGNNVVVGMAGFFLNNEMDDFSSKPGFPNMYGLIGGEANAIVPAKRMLSSMTPTIVEKDGELFIVVGSPGGSTIITSVFQTILNVVEFNMNMKGAVDFQRFHHQWRPDIIQYENGRFEDHVLEKLKDLGHELKERSAIGRVDAILVLEDGKLEGGADHRGDDTAMGF
ncbi:MAG: gamma-glutamyltransferase [Cyclobacteriaceae bacterium]|nr:gamma-glutamyltransferase [Cyclobacteriaceae bacterium]